MFTLPLFPRKIQVLYDGWNGGQNSALPKRDLRIKKIEEHDPHTLGNNPDKDAVDAVYTTYYSRVMNTLEFPVLADRKIAGVEEYTPGDLLFVIEKMLQGIASVEGNQMDHIEPEFAMGVERLWGYLKTPVGAEFLESEYYTRCQFFQYQKVSRNKVHEILKHPLPTTRDEMGEVVDEIYGNYEAVMDLMKPKEYIPMIIEQLKEFLRMYYQDKSLRMLDYINRNQSYMSKEEKDELYETIGADMERWNFSCLTKLPQTFSGKSVSEMDKYALMLMHLENTMRSHS